MTADYSQPERQWLLLRALSQSAQGVTVQQLSQEHAVSEKTTRRDLISLKKVGFPLTESNGPHGLKRWSLADSAGVPALPFTLIELAALHLGRQWMEPLAATSFWEGAQRAFQKIKASLGPPAVRHLEKLSAAIHRTSGGRADYGRKAEIIDILVEAIQDRRITFVTYQSQRSTEPVTYDVYPYGLVFHHNSLYLVARVPQYDEIRHLKVDRIDDAVLQALQFQRPADFNLRDHLAGSFGVYHSDAPLVRVRVAFSQKVARHVSEKEWHPSQQLTIHPDGSAIAEFHLSNLFEVKSWILGYGAQARALEPPELVTQITTELESLLNTYQTQPEPTPKSRKPTKNSRNTPRPRE